MYGYTVCGEQTRSPSKAARSETSSTSWAHRCRSGRSPQLPITFAAARQAVEHVRHCAPSSLTSRTGRLEYGRTVRLNAAPPTWLHAAATRESLPRLLLASASWQACRRLDVHPARRPRPPPPGKVVADESTMAYVYPTVPICMLHICINKLDHTGFIQDYVYPFNFLKTVVVLIMKCIERSQPSLCLSPFSPN
jgi:hypothetical protein